METFPHKRSQSTKKNNSGACPPPSIYSLFLYSPLVRGLSLHQHTILSDSIVGGIWDSLSDSVIVAFVHAIVDYSGHKAVPSLVVPCVRISPRIRRISGRVQRLRTLCTRPCSVLLGVTILAGIAPQRADIPDCWDRGSILEGRYGSMGRNQYLSQEHESSRVSSEERIDVSQMGNILTTSRMTDGGCEDLLKDLHDLYRH